MTRQDEILEVHGRGTHVVILGAGATYASTLRNAEKNGKQLPLMWNIVDVVGLQQIVDSLPANIKVHVNDFEKLYSTLSKEPQFTAQRREIEASIYSYFKGLELPDEPTIYDYLILSLRHNKDVIATFNWDPFLYQAYCRNKAFVKAPGILYLHGSVALGYDEVDMRAGPAGYINPATGHLLKSTEILYPVETKNYNSDPFIKGQWDGLDNRLKVAERVTVFGYSAPVSDVEAIDLLQSAWGTSEQRSMEQFEFIDIRPEADVVQSWNSFLHSSHYDCHKSFFDCSIAAHPRRSVESYHHWAMALSPDEMFQDGNPVPQNFRHLEEMWEWYKPLVEAEKAFYGE